MLFLVCQSTMEYVNFVFGNYINKNDKNIACSSSSSGNEMDVSILKLIYDHCMFWSTCSHLQGGKIKYKGWVHWKVNLIIEVSDSIHRYTVTIIKPIV